MATITPNDAQSATASHTGTYGMQQYLQMGTLERNNEPHRYAWNATILAGGHPGTLERGARSDSPGENATSPHFAQPACLRVDIQYEYMAQKNRVGVI